MTDEQIIKALECCSGIGDCLECPYTNKTDCATENTIETIDHINRQKKQLNRLSNELHLFKSDKKPNYKRNDGGQRMTDELIIEALENEIRLAEYVDSDYCSNTEVSLLKSTLNLINRQKAETERLRKETKDISIKTIKRLENKIENVQLTMGQCWEIQCAIKDVLKEMTEE